jgi:hypothetical protein
MRPAIARDRDPDCRQPTVIDEMAREIDDRNYYGKVDPKLVTETPTGSPNVVPCQVCALSAPYDTTRLGNRAIKQCLEHGFEVLILRSGFVVRDLR